MGGISRKRLALLKKRAQKRRRKAEKRAQEDNDAQHDDTMDHDATADPQHPPTSTLAMALSSTASELNTHPSGSGHPEGGALSEMMAAFLRRMAYQMKSFALGGPVIHFYVLS